MKKRACRPTSCDFADFYPKSSNMEKKKNVVAEIFNAGSENSFESNNDDNMCRKRTELTSVFKWVWSIRAKNRKAHGNDFQCWKKHPCRHVWPKRKALVFATSPNHSWANGVFTNFTHKRKCCCRVYSRYWVQLLLIFYSPTPPKLLQPSSFSPPNLLQPSSFSPSNLLQPNSF